MPAVHQRDRIRTGEKWRSRTSHGESRGGTYSPKDGKEKMLTENSTLVTARKKKAIKWKQYVGDQLETRTKMFGKVEDRKYWNYRENTVIRIKFVIYQVGCAYLSRGFGFDSRQLLSEQCAFTSAHIDRARQSVLTLLD